MDSRLTLEKVEARRSELQRHAEVARRTHEWPDDGLPPRTNGAPKRNTALHPTAVLASLLTWR
jgi:hypothetical protein